MGAVREVRWSSLAESIVQHFKVTAAEAKSLVEAAGTFTIDAGRDALYGGPGPESSTPRGVRNSRSSGWC